MSDSIDRSIAIKMFIKNKPMVWQNDDYERGMMNQYENDLAIIEALPHAEPETYEEKMKEIADALSEKFVYMNTCLNERDIILGYLGVKRPNKTHCNTDCTDTKCESNYYYKKSLTDQEIIHCKDCKHWLSDEFPGNNNVSTPNLSSYPCKNGLTAADWFCGYGKKKQDE